VSFPDRKALREPGSWPDVLAKILPSHRSLLAEAIASVFADEGTVWLLDEARQALVPVWNSGPDAAAFVGKHVQPLSVGLVSLVFVTGQALCENQVYWHAGQDPTLDHALGVLTCSMIVVPLRVGGEMRGVVSCVKLRRADSNEPDPPPFTAADLAAVGEAVQALGAGWHEAERAGRVAKSGDVP
jgi:hypothetical protein